MDLFRKIVKWIDLFKQVGDTVVQYDPVHAALPWAGVRFLLQVCSILVVKTVLKSLQIAVNDSDKFAFVVESATSIAEIICRFAVFEDVWLQSQSAATNELERALVKFYTAIMIYLSKAKRYFDENTACEFGVLIIKHLLTAFIVRRLKSGLLAQSDIESYFDAIAVAQETIDRCSSIVGMQGRPA